MILQTCWYLSLIGFGIFVGRRFEQNLKENPDLVDSNRPWLDYSHSHLRVAGMPIVRRKDGCLELFDYVCVSTKGVSEKPKETPEKKTE